MRRVLPTPVGRECRQHALEQSLVDAGGDVPDHLAGARCNEARHVEPLETMMADGDRPLAYRRPHAAQDRLQTNPVLVRGPDLDRELGVLGALLCYRPIEFFLNSAHSCSVAARAWRGRGRWIDHVSLLSTSQPRCG